MARIGSTSGGRTARIARIGSNLPAGPLEMASIRPAISGSRLFEIGMVRAGSAQKRGIQIIDRLGSLNADGPAA